MDLLMRYYKEERGITCEECTRIARAYAENEVHALNYILETHFVFKNGMYIHARCEQEILNARGISEQKRQAAKARWSKHSSKKEEKAQSCTSNARAYANAYANADAHGSAHADADALQAQCERNANAMLTNNQYIYKEKEKEMHKEKAKESFDDSLVLTSELPNGETVPEGVVENQSEPSSVESEDDVIADSESTPNRRPSIPYAKIIALYNEVVANTALPKATSLNDKRKASINARVRELAKVKAIQTEEALLNELRSIFEKLIKDPWYCGNNDRGWIANFDYIFSIKGFTRFLERSKDFQPRSKAPTPRPARRSGIQPLPNPADFSLEDA